MTPGGAFYHSWVQHAKKPPLKNRGEPVEGFNSWTQEDFVLRAHVGYQEKKKKGKSQCNCLKILSK